MGVLLDAAKTYTPSTGGVLLQSAPKKTTKTRSTDELRAEVSGLQDIQELTGAPKIDDERPGALWRIIDSLSGFNYAIAGAYEELASGKGAGAAAARAGRELYSSARSLPFGQALPELDGAQKQTFGQVFEDLGYGTTSLADLLPALEGTFIGELVNTRGTVGLALDIVSDPLNALSFGTSAVARRTLPRFAALGLKKGVNKKGLAKLNEFEAEIRAATPGLADDVVRGDAARRVLKLADESLFDPGGMKIAGVVVPGTPGVGRETLNILSAPVVTALNQRGIGVKVARSAETQWDAAKAIVRETFGAFGPLEKLAVGQREAASRIAREFVPRRALLHARYLERVKGSGFMEYFRANPGRVQEVMDSLDAGRPILGADKEAADELSALLSEVAEDGVGLGIFDQAQVDRPSWIFHNYLNSPDEVSETWVGWRGRQPAVSGKHAREREFSTMQEAERISGHLESVTQKARSLGLGTPLYAKLRPDYDLESNLVKYLDWFSGQKAMRGMTEAFRRELGHEIPDWKTVVSRIFDETIDAIGPDHPEYDLVHGFFGDHATLRKLTEESVSDPGPFSRVRGAAWDDVVKDARRRIGYMRTDAAKRQFFHEMFLRTGSEAQWADVLDSFGDDFGHLFPKAVRLEGTFEDGLKKFGDKAQYVTVGGNDLWGKGNYLVPRLVAEYVENINERIINTKDFEGWRAMVRGWDRINNLFKSAVYPFFPSSHARNAISNVALSGLRIGFHAVNPTLHRHSISIMSKYDNALERALGGEFVAANGRRYTHDEVRALIEQHNVKATANQLFELTGEGAYRIVTKPGPSKAIRAISTAIENEPRIALFVQGLMDGLSPEEAAADVAEFLFNYNELGAIHRDVIRRLIPFSVFMTKNIKLQTKMLTTQPSKVINQLKPFRGDRDENDQMAKFEAEGLKLRINRDGKTIRALTGIDLPVRNLDNIWNGGIGPTGRRFIGMMSPIIKTPIEFVGGVDLFTGRDTRRADAPTLGRLIEATRTPQAIKDWIGYKKETDAAGRPRYTFDGVKYQLLVRSFVFSRIMSTSDRQFRDYADQEGIGSMMLDVLSGLRFKDLNLDDEQRKKLSRRRSQLLDSLSRRGVLDPFEVTGKPDLEGLR